MKKNGRLSLVAENIIEHTCPLDLVESYLRRFIVYPSEYAVTAHVLWIAHTHMFMRWSTTPRLAFMSPQKGSGKTRALEVTALFVPNPRLSFSASAPALVRIISKGHEDGRIPTVLYDEIDNVFSKKEDGVSDLRAALNSGYRRGATAIRCTAHGANVVEFICFCPVAVAGLGLKPLPDTLASRSIFIHMKKRANDEEVEPFEDDIHPEQAEPIMLALTEWCDKRGDHQTGRPPLPAGIADRDADCWVPLIAIADMAGDDWPTRARQAAIHLIGASVDDTITREVELLIHIREAFLNADKIWATTLVQRLLDREESPWTDMGWGKPLDAHKLGQLLRPWRIKSRPVRDGDEVRRGYHKADFEDVWKRHCNRGTQDSGGAVTPVTSVTGLISKNKTVTDVTDVTAGSEFSDSGPDPFDTLKNEKWGLK